MARGRTRRRRLPVPGWAVVVIVIGVLAAAELFARVVGPEIPRTVGAEERVLIKSDQISQRGGDATDVVVLGSSETAGGIDPTAMGAALPAAPRVYNAGLPGSEVPFMQEWARRVVVPNLHPKVAVIGILPMSVMDLPRTEGAEGQQAAVAAYKSAIEQVDPGGLGSWGWKLRQRSDLIRYRPYLRSPTLTAKGVWNVLHGGWKVDPADVAGDATMDWTTETDPRRVARNTGPDGQVFDYRQQSVPTASDAIGAQIYDVFAQGRADLADLDDLVDWLEGQGVEAVVAIAPVDRAPLEAGGADLGPLDDVARQVEDWGRRRGVPVDDQFTQAWDSDLFHDRNHLDTQGAEAWSREVGAFVQARCQAGDLTACATG